MAGCRRYQLACANPITESNPQRSRRTPCGEMCNEKNSQAVGRFLDCVGMNSLPARTSLTLRRCWWHGGGQAILAVRTSLVSSSGLGILSSLRWWAIAHRPRRLGRKQCESYTAPNQQFQAGEGRRGGAAGPQERTRPRRFDRQRVAQHTAPLQRRRPSVWLITQNK